MNIIQTKAKDYRYNIAFNIVNLFHHINNI